MKIKPCLLKRYVTKGMVEYVRVVVFVIFVSNLPSQSSYPVWEDFITKAGKLQSQLRCVCCGYIMMCVCMFRTHIKMYM